ncbi:hypothetical protein ACNTMW_15390 [Planosporangium sp. 12N6]|uniref:hypothetical protein n=1 Tax=Planosporangium spinosum TaxID=3402278 RepID=UPI003CF68C2C
MGIEEQPPNIDVPAPFGTKSAAPSRPPAPTWADESTVAVPLAELFGDDAEE